MIEIKKQEKPLCSVGGMIQPHAMCGSVIVGGKYCGYSGECPHKREQPPAVPEVRHD